MKKRFVWLAVIFLFLAFRSVNAQEVTPSVKPSQTPVQYSLPYPGLLPSHPLYFIKDARDVIVGFFISNPLKKAEYDLLQADKNMQAAVLLKQQKQEQNSVIATLKKAEGYFAQGIDKTAEAKMQGTDVGGLAAKLALANRKHQEIVLDMIKTAQGDDKKQFTVELEQSKKLAEKVKALQHK